MTVIVDIGDGRIVEFPDVETAQNFMAGRASDESLDQIEAELSQAQTPDAVSVARRQLPAGSNEPRRDEVPAAISALGDVVGSGAAGLSRGATGLIDLPGLALEGAGNLVTSGVERAAEAVGVDAPGVFDATREAFRLLPGGSGETTQEALADLTGGATEFQGDTRAGRFAGTVGEFLPGAAAFGGANPANPPAERGYPWRSQ